MDYLESDGNGVQAENMALSQPSISGVQFQARISQQILSPFADNRNIVLPLTFSGVQNLQVLSGSYSPNNDYLMLLSGLTAQTSPNFIFVLCDSQLNLTCEFQKSNFNIPIQRMGFFSFVKDPGNFIASMFMDGRLTPNPGNSPMPQGQPVNYTLVVAQAVIS